MVLTMMPMMAFGNEGDPNLTADENVEKPNDVFDVEPVKDVKYDLLLNMLGDPAEYGVTNGEEMIYVGSGDKLIFNGDISKWYVAFNVINAETEDDARFVPESEHTRYRTYIGDQDDFVIEACEKSVSGGWEEISVLPEANIFSLSYIGARRGYSPVFEISIKPDKQQDARAAMEKYNYRVRYRGEDPYLMNGEPDNKVFVELCWDEISNSFDIDASWNDEIGDEVTGNTMHLRKINASIAFKLHIRPGVLWCAAKKIIFDKNAFIYIKNEPDKLKFLACKNGNWKALTEETSPFTVSWDQSSEQYTITYAHPERDLYGPEYIMGYGEEKINIIGKINSKYNCNVTTENVNLNNSISLITKKLTRYADSIEDSGIVDATTTDPTESEINTTEVVFSQNASGSASELTVKTNDANVTMGGGLVDNLKSANQTNDVSFLVRDVQEEPYYLTDAQKNAVSSLDKALDFRVQSKDGTQDSAIDFGADGYAKISIPCGETNPAVFYINDKGQKEEIPCTCENGAVTFTAKHFSVYGIGKSTGGSSSSGSGGSGFVPPASQDNVTNSGTTGTDNAATSADISASVSADGKASAEVSQATADKIVDKAAANQSAEVIIDAATDRGKADAATVTLPVDTLQKLVEKTDAEITVKTDCGTVTMDQKTAETIAKEAAASQVAIIIEKTRDEKAKMEFELKVVSGGKVIGTFDGGRVRVTVKLNQTLAALKDTKLTCVYIDDNGIYTKVGGKKNSDGTYTFATTHFSSYAVMAEADADQIIDEQTIETVKNTKLAARSKIVKLKNGKKAIKVYWYAKESGRTDFDGYEVYRSTKKNKGYGKKPFFTTKKTSYTNSKKLKKGIRYYYKVRGYKVIGDEKIYTPYSLKAIRTAK